MSAPSAIAAVLVSSVLVLAGVIPMPIALRPDAPRSSASPPAAVTALSKPSLAIGGISATSTEAQVRAQLGKPQRVEQKNWPCCGKIRIFSYGTTTVQLIQDVQPTMFTVFAVSTQNPRFATQNGVRVGDSQQRVIAQYGTPSSTRQGGKKRILSYSLDALAASLNFTIQGDRVVEIGFYEQLN